MVTFPFEIAVTRIALCTPGTVLQTFGALTQRVSRLKPVRLSMKFC